MTGGVLMVELSKRSLVRVQSDNVRISILYDAFFKVPAMMFAFAIVVVTR